MDSVDNDAVDDSLGLSPKDQSLLRRANASKPIPSRKDFVFRILYATA